LIEYTISQIGLAQINSMPTKHQNSVCHETNKICDSASWILF